MVEQAKVAWRSVVIVGCAIGVLAMLLLWAIGDRWSEWRERRAYDRQQEHEGATDEWSPVADVRDTTVALPVVDAEQWWALPDAPQWTGPAPAKPRWAAYGARLTHALVARARRLRLRRTGMVVRAITSARHIARSPLLTPIPAPVRTVVLPERMVGACGCGRRHCAECRGVESTYETAAKAAREAARLWGRMQVALTTPTAEWSPVLVGDEKLDDGSLLHLLDDGLRGPIPVAAALGPGSVR